MLIFADAENFKPEHFVIIDFYGVETCFAWQNENLVTFPYGQTTSPIPKQQIIVAPREIKIVRSFEGRVFVICKPAGVYKLNKLLKFCLLSQTGIGLGRFYYEVLCAENQWLYMKNKSTKTNRQLFPLEPTCSGDLDICEITLSSATSDQRLRKTICQLDDSDNQDVCVVAYKMKIFAITSKDVELIHCCQQEIRDIVPILGKGTVVGFVVVSKNSAVLVHAKDKELVFDRIYLDSEVRRLCAGFYDTFNDIWIVHIDDSCIYYSSKTVGDGTFRRTRLDSARLLEIRNYKNKILVGLSNEKQLLEIEIQQVGLGMSNSEEFFNLKPEMLKGGEKIMDEVCERAKTLQVFNDILLDEQEKLRRINIYAHKQAIVYLPRVKVKRIADQMFLRVEFCNVLPNDCHIVVALKSRLQTTHCMKLVEDCRVLVDVPVDIESLDDSLELCIDLVTLACDSEPWCLIRNYAKSPKVDNARANSERAKFLKAKLTAIQNLKLDGTLDMKKLSNIKKSIRKEVSSLE